MFKNHAILVKKSGKKGVDRPDYLKELIEEYKNSNNKDVQEQVLANLANFCYDPLNFKWLVPFGIIEIFLQEISSNSGIIQEFCIAGLCNLSFDCDIGQLIIKKGGISVISPLLGSSNENCIANAITALIYLTNTENRKDIIDDSTLNQLKKHLSNESKRIRNLAQIFITDNFPVETNA